MVEVRTAPVLVPDEKLEVENGDTPASPPADDGRPRAKERAEAFVREQLANGPRHGELVKRDAAEYATISVDRGRRSARRALAARAWWLPGYAASGCKSSTTVEQIAFNQD